MIDHDQAQNLFFLDREGLAEIAGTAAIRDGLALFKEHRVLALDADQNNLWATVEGDDPKNPLDLSLQATDDGLRFSCPCGGADGKACAHVVAALLAHGDRLEASGRLMTASDTAIRDRIKRGRAEVRVEPLGTDCYGDWRAASLTSTTHFPQTYKVSIRDLEQRANFCTCPDFANNQLGTCKHVEAVLHRIAKRADHAALRERGAPFSSVYLAWDVDEAPRVQVHRARGTAPELEALLADFFEADGAFKGRLPDDYFRFRGLVEDRADLHLGEDVERHVRLLASLEAQRRRAAGIGERIRAGQGRLPGIRARLYPYQVEGVAFLAGTSRALLADDMGLGKTLQAIAAATWLLGHEDAHRVLIVCPASLKHQWAREVERFTAHDCQVIQGPPGERGVQYRRECAFFVVNYELILRDLSLINEQLRPDLIILDEAQRIKNWRTKIANAVKLLNSRHAFVLSGTPLENRLEDLYSLMQVVDPRILGPLWRYMIDFHVTNDHGKVLGYRNLALLRRRLAPVMLRRDRRLVRDQLPDRIVQRLDVDMTDKQRELHDDAMRAAGIIAQIAKRRPLTPVEQNRLMAALQSARMACDAAGLVDKETEGSPKLDELENILDEFCLQAGLKAVVFSQWEKMTLMVEARLRRMGLGFVRLHGGVPTAKRGELMDRFREDDSVQIFISTDAGGVGLNLQSGSVLVNLDVPWNPAVLEQRNGRIHRLGQKNKVQIINMVASGSYEERVLGLLMGKQNLFDNVISEDAGEDVVGVSKKLLESLVEDLAARDTAKPDKSRVSSDPEEGHAPPEPSGGSGGPSQDRVVEAAITTCIEGLQAAFGARIERILGSAGGLIVVLDRVDAQSDAVAARLSDKVGVALVDRLILAGLERLGAASPMANGEILYSAAEDQGRSRASRLARLAGEKLQAARVLMAQSPDSARELLLSALLAAASDRAGRDQAVAARDAGVWLYAEALPQGLLSQDDAALIMRAVGLAQADTLPEALCLALLDEVAAFVERDGSRVEEGLNPAP